MVRLVVPGAGYSPLTAERGPDRQSTARKDRTASQGPAAAPRKQNRGSAQGTGDTAKIAPGRRRSALSDRAILSARFLPVAGSRAAPPVACTGDGDAELRPEAGPRPHPRTARQSRDPRARRTVVLRSKSFLRTRG